jgi:anaphase-promoting complex subunit 5
VQVAFNGVMARYLTPAKIGILVLIELYTDSIVPTASTIPILSFIISHLLPSSLPKPHNTLPGEKQQDSRHNFAIPIEDYRRLLSAYSSASGVPGRTLWDLFLKKLWAIDSLHALHEFFDLRQVLLTKTREEAQKEVDAGVAPPNEDAVLISRTSPIGAFIRRANIEFTRLKFHDSFSLWKSFLSYRQPTLPAWQKRNPHMGNFSFDSVLRVGDEEWEPDALEQVANVAYGDFLSDQNRSEGFNSTDDVEKLLEFQIEQMQSRSCFLLERDHTYYL